MPSLEIIQKEFVNKLLEYGAFPKNINDEHPLERFDIYRQTIFENCRHALELTFPSIWQELSFANKIAGLFLQEKENWPSTGCLEDWGAKFPNFLMKLSEASEPEKWRNLAELAQYDWLCHCANLQPELPALTAEDLANMDDETKMSARFQFQPSFFLHNTTFSLKKFESVWLVIMFQKNQLMTYEIQEREFVFFQKLKENATLSEAYEFTIKHHPHFSLTQALVFLFNNMAFVKRLG